MSLARENIARLRKTHFTGFILPDIPKPNAARWPELSMKLCKSLTTASLSGTATSTPMVERERLAKLVSEKPDHIGLTPAGRHDASLCVRWAGYWRDS